MLSLSISYSSWKVTRKIHLKVLVTSVWLALYFLILGLIFIDISKLTGSSLICNMHSYIWWKICQSEAGSRVTAEEGGKLHHANWFTIFQFGGGGGQSWVIYTRKLWKNLEGSEKNLLILYKYNSAFPVKKKYNPKQIK